MSLSFTEKMGLLRQTVEFMEQNADMLKQAGFNTDIRLTEQKSTYDNAAAQNEKQESLKAELHEQTKIVNESMKAAYVMASGNIDAMSGILSKDSERSKVLRQIRSKVKQAGKAKVEAVN